MVGLIAKPDKYNEPYWNAHLLNARGIPLDDVVLENVEDVLFAWHLYMALKSKVSHTLRTT